MDAGKRWLQGPRGLRVLTSGLPNWRMNSACCANGLILEENENYSLQLSLDLTTSENSCLSGQLADSERQVRKLEQLHAKLIDDMNILLMTCKRRDAALARAEERLRSLADLFVQLEAANFPKSQKTRGDINLPPQHELDIDKWLLAETNTVSKKAI